MNKKKGNPIARITEAKRLRNIGVAYASAARTQIYLEPPPYFQDMRPPNGYLGPDKEEHALFYYSILAYKLWEKREKNTPIVLEGHDDPARYPNYKDLLIAVAMRYGITPESMTKNWRVVDLTYDMNKFDRLPDIERIRFNRTPEIKTQ